MNIRFLETALYLASCRSFRLTAEHLHITQAAISSRIAVLEEEFGERLFERDTKKVSLTPAGERFVGAAGDVLASYAHLRQVMTKTSGLEGLVRIGAVSSMVHLVLPGLISRIRALYPRVTLDIVSDDTGGSFQARLREGTIDFCLTALPEHLTPGIKAQPLCTVDMAWYASGQLVATPDAVHATKDLARYPIITYAQGSVNGERIKAYLKDADIDECNFLTSSSLATSVRMATQRLGVAALPDFMVEQEVAAGTLHKLRLATPYPATQYCTMYSQLREKGDVSALHGLCVEAAIQTCEGRTTITPCRPA